MKHDAPLESAWWRMLRLLSWILTKSTLILYLTYTFVIKSRSLVDQGIIITVSPAPYCAFLAVPLSLPVVWYHGTTSPIRVGERQDGKAVDLAVTG
jgi:hypothetical protein